MGKIRITMDVPEEDSDPTDDSGLTNETFEAILDALMAFGDDIDVQKAD